MWIMWDIDFNFADTAISVSMDTENGSCILLLDKKLGNYALHILLSVWYHDGSLDKLKAL